MSMQQPETVTLILGGVRSGKSRFAQRLAERRSRVTFLATAERRDDAEMHARVERHRADRPATWQTMEEPLHLAQTVRDAGEHCDLLLIDCLTLYASNLLEAYDAPAIEAETAALCMALTNPPCSVVLVSNEVGSGVVPAYELGRRFRDLAGELNQRVAAVADTVVLMVAGLPLPVKGSLPAKVQP
jgi:adenosylcobinamide kinase/adenosylcobinamide-phosphate guanylyltransferase